MKRAAVVALVVAVFAVGGVQAQEAVQEFYKTYDPVTMEKVYRIVQPDTFPKKVPDRAKVVFKGRATWNITYQDVIDTTGAGFDAAAGVGATRQATALAATAYLDGVLNEGGTCDIHFGTSVSVGGVNWLASAGPSGSCTNGCQNGNAYVYLTTGVDPSANPDMNITVDFGHTWNSDLGAPAGGEYDLFSVLLHEMGHGIGLTSFTMSDGTSFTTLMCAGGETVYSFWDDQIYRTTGTVNMWSCSPAFTGSVGDLTSNDLDWRGANAVASYGGNVPIFAPSPWDDGSSIAHWTSGAAANSLMQPSIGPGVQRRQLLSWEIQALVDIGYDGAVPVELMSISIE